MTPSVLQLEIVSAEKSIFSDKVSMIYLTGMMGELGIMPGHSPLLTRLKPGNLHFVLPDGKEEIMYLSGGFLEVQPYFVTVLADTVLREKELDEASALEAKTRAEKILSEKTNEIDFARATAELAEAIAQIRTLQKLRKHKK